MSALNVAPEPMSAKDIQNWREILETFKEPEDCQCEPSSPCRRSCHRCQGTVRGFTCPCQSTSFRNALPRKPGSPMPLYKWRPITEVFDKPIGRVTNVQRTADSIEIRYRLECPDCYARYGTQYCQCQPKTTMTSSKYRRYKYRRETRDGYELSIIDGFTIKPLIDRYGVMPQPPYPAYQDWITGQLYTSDELTPFDEPKEFPTIAGRIRFVPDDVDQELAEPVSEIAKRIMRTYEVTPTELGITETHQSGKSTAAIEAFIAFSKQLIELVSAPGELGITEKPKNTPRTWPYPVIGVPPEMARFVERDLEDTKPFDDVRAWLSAGIITPSEARRYLGLPEPEKRKEPIPALNPDDWVIVTPGYKAKPEKPTEHDGAVFIDGTGYVTTEALKSMCQAAKCCTCIGCMSFLDRYEPKPASNPWDGLDTLISSMNTKENPMSISNSTNDVADLANQARELAKDGKTNLDNVKRAIDQGKQERKERIEKALSGAADLEVLKGAQGKQFVVKHFYGNKECTVYGTAYPGYSVTSEEAEDELKAYTIFLQDCRDPMLYSKYKTMQRLRKTIEEYEVPYVIKFYE